MKKVFPILLILIDLIAPAQIPAQGVAKPKLVVTIVVDQFRYDYLLRFTSDYTDGLHTLLGSGAVFANARYEHVPTYTAVGHSTILSGALPAVSGIVANEWYDRESGRPVTAVSDDATQLIGGQPGPGASPHRLLVSTLGDEMKIASKGQAKVIAISLKDRAAILTAGHMADAAYWLDLKSGNYVTSSHYLRELPAWVKGFNAQRPADRYRDAEWMGKKMPASAGEELYEALTATPFGDQLTQQFAEEAIKAERLGLNSVTDLLIISYSCKDYVGHQYGPESPQVRDISKQIDRLLGRLFKLLDSQVGLENVLVVFTADHGVAPLSEHGAQGKMPGGAVSSTGFPDAVQKRLEQKYGRGKWVTYAAEEAIYLNWNLINRKNLRQADVEDLAAKTILAMPHVARVYPRHELVEGRAMQDQVGRRLTNSYSAKRGADLYVVLEPYWSFDAAPAMHGSPFGYDTHVPVVFMGVGIKAGPIYTSAAVNDIAPTLATILGIEMPSGSDGRILSEILDADARGDTRIENKDR